MATSNTPLAPDPVTDGPEPNQPDVPMTDIEDDDGDRETLEYEPPRNDNGGLRSKSASERDPLDDDHRELHLVPIED
jgi:hypothetical protein